VARDPQAIPTGKARRATKTTAALAPSTVRFFGTLATNVARSPESAQQILERRHEEIADHALEVLGTLRGGAMKLGQLASFVDVDILPPEYRAIYQRKLAELRDAAPPMSWKKVRRVLEAEWEEPVESLFEAFEPEAAAAASIGQVHRAVLPGGRRVAVKVQYPEVADALASDVEVAAIGVHLARALAPGLDPRAVMHELRERILEELDYELEAQHQRAFARAYRDHPFAFVPAVHTALCRRRVLVSDWVEGRRFEEILALPQAERDRVGEIIDRFFFGSMYRCSRFNTDPHPGNYLLAEDGRMAFLDFGSTKVVDPAWLAAGDRTMAALIDGDAARFRDEVGHLGYLHRPDHIDADLLLAQAQATGEWFLHDEVRTIDSDYVGRVSARLLDLSPQIVRQARAMKVPPEEVWFRRLQVGVFAVLGHLRATANWHRIMRQYIFEEEPSTELGRLDWAFWADRLPSRP